VEAKEGQENSNSHSPAHAPFFAPNFLSYQLGGLSMVDEHGHEES
jgi:hypothetical protein